MNRRHVGAAYEEIAAAYLTAQGYVVRERNFRARSGEIDIIAQEENVLCFIEVKYRADLKDGGPLAAVDHKKQRTISRTALYYLLKNGYPTDTPCRFDVVGILDDQITLIRDAFPYT